MAGRELGCWWPAAPVLKVGYPAAAAAGAVANWGAVATEAMGGVTADMIPGAEELTNDWDVI